MSTNMTAVDSSLDALGQPRLTSNHIVIFGGKIALEFQLMNPSSPSIKDTQPSSGVGQRSQGSSNLSL